MFPTFLFSTRVTMSTGCATRRCQGRKIISGKKEECKGEEKEGTKKGTQKYRIEDRVEGR